MSDDALREPRYVYEPRHEKSFRLIDRFSFVTDITGYTASMGPTTLLPDGRLFVSPGYCWDGGTGAIDTPSMVVASLAHDIFCEMVNAGLLPWDVRQEADVYFRRLLRDYAPTPWARAWAWVRWAAVSAYRETRRPRTGTGGAA